MCNLFMSVYLCNQTGCLAMDQVKLLFERRKLKFSGGENFGRIYY